MERQFKGIWIPAKIWLTKSMTIMEKVICAEVDNNRPCFCSNAHFAELLQVSARRVQQVIEQMVSKGILVRTVQRDEKNRKVVKRYLKINRF